MLSLVQIQQGHSIYMLNGIVEIRNSSNNQVIVTRYEDVKLLKLKGSSARVQKIADLFRHEECTMSSRLLWHAIYEHLNYNIIFLDKKNGVSIFPTIPKKMNQYDVCIQGKHTRQHSMSPNSKHVGS